MREINRTAYETFADEFHTTRLKPWHEVIELASAIRDGARILDLGCGNGRLLKGLPKVNFTYTGIDANEYLLARAREEFPEHTFQKTALEEIALAPESYDAIFCIATFHHLTTREDRVRLLKECHTALVSKGALIMTVWNLWQPKYGKYFFAKWWDKVSWNDFFIPWGPKEKRTWRYYHAFTAGELRGLLQEAGFTDIKIMFMREGKKVRWGNNYCVKATT